MFRIDNRAYSLYDLDRLIEGVRKYIFGTGRRQPSSAIFLLYYIE